MPLYEYYCTHCSQTFERLRPAQQADDPVACPGCESAASQRILSLFASTVKNTASDAVPIPASAMGGCCGGACGCHAH